MFSKNLLIAAAALICYILCSTGSYADVSEINLEPLLAPPKEPAAEQELLVPFNDLLPPLVQDESSVSTTTTTTTTTPKPTTARTTRRTTTTTTTTASYNKPTKKSYYQQKQQQQESFQQDTNDAKTGIVDQQNIQSLSLDLLPPLEEAVTNELDSEKPQPSIFTQTAARATNIAPLPTPPVRKPIAIAVKPTVSALLSSSPASASSVALPQRHAAVAHRQSSSGITYTSQLSTATSAPFSAALNSQYASYFQFSTPRAPRGPLPTLTPFPRYQK